jgi:hypothetical protein
MKNKAVIKRNTILKLAAKYTKEDLSLWDKNSNIDNDTAIYQISQWCIESETIRRIFLEKAKKL